MKTLLDWIDQRTGLRSASVGDWLDRPVAGGPAWRFVWPATIVFTFVTQAITGLVLWMYYSPGAQTAWESVYYLQYHVQGGWLLRAIHYYTAQVMLVLVGIYLLQMIVRGSVPRPARVPLLDRAAHGARHAGPEPHRRPAPWDQNSYWATHVRTGFLFLLPGVGDWLYKLAVGGAEFGISR